MFGKRTTTKKARRREEELPVRLRTYRLILLSLLTVDHREFDITSIHLIYQVIDPIILIMIVDAFLLLFLFEQEQQHKDKVVQSNKQKNFESRFSQSASNK